MNKCCVIIAIAFLCFFLSCSKDAEHLESVIDMSESFSYSDTIEIYSDDDLSSATIVVSSNDEKSFLEAKSSLILKTDINVERLNANQQEYQIEQNDVCSEVEIDILDVKTNLSFIGISHKPSTFKGSYIEPTKKTYTYTCVEKDWLMSVEFDFISEYDTGIKVKFGHKDCWLCDWVYDSYYYLLSDRGQNGLTCSNPWNGKKSVWKLSAKVTTDLGKSENYDIVLTDNPR